MRIGGLPICAIRRFADSPLIARSAAPPPPTRAPDPRSGWAAGRATNSRPASGSRQTISSATVTRPAASRSRRVSSVASVSAYTQPIQAGPSCRWSACQHRAMLLRAAQLDHGIDSRLWREQQAHRGRFLAGGSRRQADPPALGQRLHRPCRAAHRRAERRPGGLRIAWIA